MEFTVALRKKYRSNIEKYVESMKAKAEDDIVIYSHDLFKEIRKLGSGVQGSVVLASLKKHAKYTEPKRVSIKFMKMRRGDKKFLNKPHSSEALKREVFIDITAMTLMNQLVFQNVCPNFRVNYMWEYSDKDKVLVQISEYINYTTFEEWTQARRTTAQWYNAFFQIFVALYAIKKYYNMSHTDLHGNNILVHKVKPGGYWEYIIEGRKYYVPNLGFVFLVFDFGYSWIPDHMQLPWYHKKLSKRLSEYERTVFDIDKLKYVFKYATHSPKAVQDDLFHIIEMYTNEKTHNVDLNDIIQVIWAGTYVKDDCFKKNWHCYHKRNVTGDLLEKYSLDKNLKLEAIPRHLRYLVNKI